MIARLRGYPVYAAPGDSIWQTDYETLLNSFGTGYDGQVVNQTVSPWLWGVGALLVVMALAKR